MMDTLLSRLCPRLMRPAMLHALLLSLPGPAFAQDYMGMVEQYGHNLQNLLQTEIFVGMSRASMDQGGKGSGGAGPEPEPVWPVGISEGDALSRVFSIDELAAMRGADPDRLRAMIDGEIITVQGLVSRNPRSDSSFNLIGQRGEGYRVWAHWRRDFDLPAEGDLVTLRGRAEMERRSFLTMREAEFVSHPQLPAPAETAKPETVAPAGSAGFTPSARVSREVNRLLAKTLEPALTTGRSADELLAILDTGRLQAAFRQILSEQGFSEHDLGDVLAAHLIVLWQVANDRPDLDEPGGYQLIRRAMHMALVESEWPLRLGDAQKQTYAELMGTGSMLIVASYLDAVSAGNATARKAAMADARQLVLAHSGVDLLAYDLTPEGLIER